MKGEPSLFDARASEWDANPLRVALARAVADAIREEIPLQPGMQVMDFGAGTGLVSLALLAAVAGVTAVDASGEMLRVLNEKARALGAATLHTLQCDIAHAALPAERFDLIVSSMVLHHLPDVPLVLKTLWPSLRRGGRIALADLDSEDGSFHTDATGVYHNGFERQTVLRWLAEAGFVECAAREAYRFARPDAGGVPHAYSVFLVTARKP